MLHPYVDKVKENGLYIYGNGITITNVTISKGDPVTDDDTPTDTEVIPDEEVASMDFNDESADESSITTTENPFDLNKIYSQKTASENGKYSQRFIKQVSMADLEGAQAYYIVIKGNGKNVKVKCNVVSSSVTINGNLITADEGCVFLTAAVLDVNDAITLEYTDFEVE